MPDSIRGGAEGHPRRAFWSFDLGSGLVPWIGSAPPDARTLRHVRRIRSRSGAGHVPTWAYSTTIAGHLRLESGLEHDLVRDLDRDPQVTWLVAQPARVNVDSAVKRPGPVPDLLSMSDDGAVTIWSVRPKARQDEKFLESVAQTETACAEFGWIHRVFSGMSTVRRSNLMWLDGYRTTMPWYEDALSFLRDRQGPLLTLGDVLAADAGGGHILSAVWHAVRHGAVECDLNMPFTEATELRFPSEAAA